MPLIDIKSNPSTRDLRIFALMWLAFFAVLGVLALGKPSALFGAGVFTGTCFVISIAFNRDFPIRKQLMGLLIPTGLLAIGGAERYLSADQWTVAIVVWVLGVVGCMVTFISDDLARRLYSGWMFAALPIGWTVSHLVLGAAYYLVLTPIGLVLRLLGNDPMNRRFDPAATTYWIKRGPPPDSSRYFKQF
ncbi:MAG TPA: SxtJ family membrane protein [Phycisphaerales bacterium]|nr:SxtJ family membrane protein [Phycisphaerales bacterium]